jgi:hypothetical protein
MASTAQYVTTPKNSAAQVATANTNRDGTGTLATVYTAGTSGARIDSILIQATGTTTAGMIRFFESIDGGTTKRLVGEVAVTAATPSGTVAAFSAYIGNGDSSGFMKRGLVLQANAILYASTHNAETFNIIPVIAGDF